MLQHVYRNQATVFQIGWFQGLRAENIVRLKRETEFLEQQLNLARFRRARGSNPKLASAYSVV